MTWSGREAVSDHAPGAGAVAVERERRGVVLDRDADEVDAADGEGRCRGHAGSFRRVFGSAIERPRMRALTWRPRSGAARPAHRGRGSAGRRPHTTGT